MQGVTERRSHIKGPKRVLDLDPLCKISNENELQKRLYKLFQL